MYYPKSQIVVNLYTNGQEYVIKSSKENYIGSFWKTADGKFFTGKTPESKNIQELILSPSSTTASSLSNDVYVNNSYTAANTANTIYTTPANTQTMVTTLNVCNQDNVARTYSVAVVPSGNTLSAKHYVAYQASINASSYIPLVLSFAMNANDSVIVVSPNTANVSFVAFGLEMSNT